MDTSQHWRRWPNFSHCIGHCIGAGLYSLPAVSTSRPVCYWTQPSKHEALNQCWFDAGPASQTVGLHWSSIGSSSVVFAGSLDKPPCVSHICVVPKRRNKFRLIHSLYCPQEPFNNINYKSQWHYIYLAINLYDYAAGGETSSVFLFTKNCDLSTYDIFYYFSFNEFYSKYTMWIYKCDDGS